MDIPRQIALLITQSRLPHVSKKGFLEGPDYPRLLCTPLQIKSQLGNAVIKHFDQIACQSNNVICIEIWVKQCTFEWATNETLSKIADLTWPQRVTCSNEVNTEDFVLMEQWTLSILKDGDASNCTTTPLSISNLMVKNARSHLYYSQIRAMLQESQGKMPSNILYNICSRNAITKFPGSPLKTIFPAASLSSTASLHLQVTYQPSFIQSQQNSPNKRRQSIDLGLGIKNGDTNLQANGVHLNNREKTVIDNRPRRNSLADCTSYSYGNNIKQEEINMGLNKRIGTSAVNEVLVDVLKNVSATQQIDAMNHKNDRNIYGTGAISKDPYNLSQNSKGIEINETGTKHFDKQKAKTIGSVSKSYYDSNNDTINHHSIISNKKVIQTTLKKVASPINLPPKMKDNEDGLHDLPDKSSPISSSRKSVFRLRSKSFNDRDDSNSTPEATGKVSSPVSPRHSNVSRFKLFLFRLHLKELTQNSNDDNCNVDDNSYRRRSASLGSYKQKLNSNNKETETTRRYSLHLPKAQSATSPDSVHGGSMRNITQVGKDLKTQTAENSAQVSGNVAAFIKNQKFSVHQNRCSSPPIGLHEQRLLGNFEESVLNNRLESSGRIHGFKVTLSVLGSSAQIVTLPMTTFYYNVSDNKAPSPYLGIASLQFLNKSRYQIPKKGTINLTIYNPQETIIKVFKASYDLCDMPSKSKTFLRQRTSLITNRRSDKHTLLYVIHLRFISSKSNRIYLYSEIKTIFPHNCNLKVQQHSSQSGEAFLETVTEGPTPRYADRN